MSELLDRLQAAGFSRAYLRRVVLPEWWDDAMAETPAGYAEGLAYVARHVGIPMDVLRDHAAPITCDHTKHVRYKLKKGDGEESVRAAACVAMQAAALAAHATPCAARPVPVSAYSLRRELLASGARWPDLDALLDACWSHGIPVIHLAALPPGRRPHGLAARVGERGVIVLMNGDRHSAWQLYRLAHELGHIARGHLKPGDYLLDEDIATADRDEEEAEANRYAAELLTGSRELWYALPPSFRADALARWAEGRAGQDQVDPGIIALAHGHNRSRFPVANAALALLAPDEDAPAIIRDRMARELDWDRLPEESAAFLRRITGLES